MPSRPYRWLVAVILIGWGAAGAGPDPGGLQDRHLTPAVDQAIDRGLEYMKSKQLKDGSFKYGGFIVGPTGINILAFLANGHLPHKGPYGPTVAKAVNFLLKSQNATGIWDCDMSQYMYGHGFALLALSDVWGEYPDPQGRLQEAIERAIEVAEGANKLNTHGGWRYSPNTPSADTSVTSAVLQGMRAAREAFFEVKQETMDRAAGFLLSCANPDGGFGYTKREAGNICRTGIGVLGLMACGYHHRPEVLKGVEWLRRRTQLQDRPGYSAYYSVLAMYQARTLVGDQAWNEWYPKIQSQILKAQNSDGSFGPGGDSMLDTGFMVIALSIQKNLLPLFQK